MRENRYFRYFFYFSFYRRFISQYCCLFVVITSSFGTRIIRMQIGPRTIYESSDRWPPLIGSTQSSVVTTREFIVVQYYPVFTSDKQLLIELFIGNNSSKIVIALIELISAFNKKVVHTRRELLHFNAWQPWFLCYTIMLCFLHIWRVNGQPFVSRRQTFNFLQIVTKKISRIFQSNFRI